MKNNANFEYSERVFKKHAKSFSFAAQGLSRGAYRKAAALYAFCRYCDDLADTALSQDEKWIAKNTLSEIASQLMHGQSQHPIVAAFLELIHQDAVPLSAALSLLEGIRADLEPVRIVDQEALLIYAYQVAGTVGEMVSPILGCTNEVAKQHAVHLGMAMQLTNISRDVFEDASLDRIYLPTDWLGFIEPQSVFLEKNTPIIKTAIKRTLSLAELYYQDALHGLRYLPLRSRFVVVMALRLYRSIGLKIAKNDYRYWCGRTKLTKTELITTAGKSVLACAFGQYQHDCAKL